MTHISSPHTSGKLAAAALAVALLFAPGCTQKEQSTMNISVEPFGKTPEGTAVDLYTLTNGRLTVKITTFGGAITELWIPDKNGKTADVVLGFDSLAGYLGKNPYFGCLVGRYANRIARGTFTLEGKRYTLATNDNQHHLHGGRKGFDKVVWSAEPVKARDSVSLRLTYLSPDGEEGYPGNLSVTVVYTLDAKDELTVSYEASTDKTTIINLTQHSYFNLAGAGSGDVLSHQLMINARRYTPVDDGLIPTGEIATVEGGPMDFQALRTIGSGIGRVKGGYDHNYVLERSGPELSLAARAVEPVSGRAMEIWTTEPGVQFYSGNFLDGSIVGKGGKAYQKHFGFCLETQHFPDSPNRPAFPTTVLKPGERYTQQTVFRFSTAGAL